MVPPPPTWKNVLLSLSLPADVLWGSFGEASCPCDGIFISNSFYLFLKCEIFLFLFDSEEDLSSTSDSSSSNSSSQNGVKQPLSPREFWKEKAGEWDQKVSAGISTKQ